MKGNGRVLSLPLKTRFYQCVLVILIIGLTTLVCSPLSNSQSYHIVSFILLFVVAMLAVFMGIDKVLEVARNDFRKHFDADSWFILQDTNRNNYGRLRYITDFTDNRKEQGRVV